MGRMVSLFTLRSTNRRTSPSLRRRQKTGTLSFSHFHLPRFFSPRRRGGRSSTWPQACPTSPACAFAFRLARCSGIGSADCALTGEETGLFPFALRRRGIFGCGRFRFLLAQRRSHLSRFHLLTNPLYRGLRCCRHREGGITDDPTSQYSSPTTWEAIGWQEAHLESGFL
jgi:hypothetical protein